MTDNLRIRLPLDQVIDIFNEAISAAENFLCAARSSRLQLEQCFALDMHLKNATDLKLEAIRREEEDYSNLFLGFECVIGALRSELLMWILLKQDSPGKAWDQLVAAQIGCLHAIRAHRGFSKCESRLPYFKGIESTLFPPQVFVSAAFVSDRIDCSICGERYSKCTHLSGKPYMGRFCDLVHRNPRGDHIALVDSPADRRCRVTSVRTEHGHRDRLTWEISPYGEGEEFQRGGHSSFLALNRYPYLEPTSEALGELINVFQSITPPPEPERVAERE